MDANIKRIDFETGIYTSYGKVIPGTEESFSILFNKTVISEGEVKKVINRGTFREDRRMIVTTTDRADALRGVLQKESGAHDRKNT